MIQTFADSPQWTGRIDNEEGLHALRWHQCVSPYAPGVNPGVALLGFVCDEGVARNHGRIGASAGPNTIRSYLARLAWHQRIPVYDAGNVVCEGDHLEAAQDELGHELDELLTTQHYPIVLGGGHELSFGVWQGLAAYASRQVTMPSIGIISLDAQFNLRADRQANSGTPFRQVADDCSARGWPFRFACLGVAQPANAQSLFERARALGVTWLSDKALRRWQPETLQRFIDESDWIYLSIDLDVLPAAVAPGVSAPAAYGVDLAIVEEIVDQVRDSGKVRITDIAEFNPKFDIDGHTARIAARLVYQLTL